MLNEYCLDFYCKLSIANFKLQIERQEVFMNSFKSYSEHRTPYSALTAGAVDGPAHLSRTPRRRNLHFAICSLQFAILILLAGIFDSAPAFGQSSSLFGSSDARRPMTLEEYSWTYQKPVSPQPIKLHSHLTVLVDEKSVVISEGQMDRKKKAYGDLKLPNWILFKGFSMIPDPQTAGSPHVRGEVDNKMRSQANLETRDKMTFKMACEVVDIRPNGVMVLEGRRTITNNEEVWEYTLTGEIEPRVILPDNTVRSENISNLRINKREEGHVRDGYRQGWLLRWLDKYQPF
jgi:flagellar L-ring protein FlgH